MSDPVTVIESPRFGTLEISPERIIEFPVGLPGFDSVRKFTLFHPEGGDLKYFLLQSVEHPELAFHITEPARLGFNYEIALSDEEENLIDLKDPADAVVVVILLRDGPPGQPLRANLKAPLILNLKARKGLQHVFARLDYQVTLKSPA